MLADCEEHFIKLDLLLYDLQDRTPTDATDRQTDSMLFLWLPNWRAAYNSDMRGQSECGKINFTFAYYYYYYYYDLSDI